MILHREILVEKQVKAGRIDETIGFILPSFNFRFPNIKVYITNTNE